MPSVLPPTADKPRYVAEMFGRIAGRYDLLNTLMTGGQDARWRRIVAETILDGARPPGVVLDVGTGTGKLARTIRELDQSVTVVGIDFTEAMLRAAAPGLRLASADALRLPFADATFDAVVSAFVVRNVADVAAAIAEQVRVLRPGGRLVVMETTPGPLGVLRRPYQLYFRTVVPVLGQLIAGDGSAYTYLPESTLAFVEPARLVEGLRQHGLREVSTRRLTLGTVAVTQGLRPA